MFVMVEVCMRQFSLPVSILRLSTVVPITAYQHSMNSALHTVETESLCNACAAKSYTVYMLTAPGAKLPLSVYQARLLMHENYSWLLMTRTLRECCSIQYIRNPDVKRFAHHEA